MTTTIDSDKTGKDEQNKNEKPASRLPRPTLIKQEPRTYKLNKYGDYLFIEFIPGNLCIPVYGNGALVRIEVKDVFARCGFTQYEILDTYEGPQIFFKYGIEEEDYELANKVAKKAIEFMDDFLADTLYAWRMDEDVQNEFRRDFLSMEADVVRKSLKERGCQHPSELPLSHPVRQWYDGNPSEYIEYVMEEIKSWEERNK